MFRQLSNSINKALNNLSNKKQISESDLKDTIEAIKLALINADVAIEVIEQFIKNIKNKTLGQPIPKNIAADQFLKKLIHNELVTTLDQDSNLGININAKKPIIILICGLQGSGKTTSAAKLAKTLNNSGNQNILLCSTDVARPGAIEQLAILAKETQTEFFETKSQSPIEITKQALNYINKSHNEILIIDTAGRLHIDQELMQEIKQIHQLANPTETLFVLDSNVGQEAAHFAKEFNNQLSITGSILTKIDGDSKGGAALSARTITNKPIKYISDSEKVTDGLKQLDAHRLADQILDLGDIAGLVESLESKLDKQTNESLAKRLKKGQFDFNDFETQIKQMQKIGGMKSFINKMPGAQQYAAQIEAANPDKEIKKTLAVIQSMTIKEKTKPDLVSGRRKKRIANGSGTSIPEVNKTLKQFKQMQKMIKKTKGGKLKSLIENMGLNEK